MKRFVLVLIATLMTVNSFAQTIKGDKTTDEGRKIMMESKKYYGTDRDDKMALHYISHGDAEVFLLDLDFDESGKTIEAGYKMLLKQSSNNIMELVCVQGDHNTRYNMTPFVWALGIIHTEKGQYLLTREEVESIIHDPVVKIRVEYQWGYFDVNTSDLVRKSKFSYMVEKMYNRINDALENQKTGLYDGF